MEPVGYYRLEQVLTIIPISKTTWNTGVLIGYFPKPVKYARMSFWKKHEIHELVDAINDGTFFILKKKKELEYAGSYEQ
ncbi:MAG: hypothetical protein DELT_02220 [Desulfovibrio sp.]